MKIANQMIDHSILGPSKAKNELEIIFDWSYICDNYPPRYMS